MWPDRLRGRRGAIRGDLWGDFWGGLSASAVMLPQAAAFGIALWAPYSQDTATGAMAGLITVIALCFFSGLSGGTSGMVSSPTGPTMVLVAGALASLSAAGLAGGELALSIALMLVITGVLQLLLGLSNGGRLIKYIPYPVVAGFMTGSALLMIDSQAHMLELFSVTRIVEQALWIPWLTAALTFAAMSLLPKRLPAIPGTVSGLVAGSLLFHLLVLLSDFSYPQTWVVGRLPDISGVQLVLPTSLPPVPWHIILPVSLALAVLSSLDSLLTSVIADVASGERHDARRELAGQGLGQIVAALFGGIAGAGTTGATLVSIRSGGRRYAALVSAGGFLLIIVLLGPVAALLPVSVLAGIILHVAVMDMIERDILAWLKRRKSRMDAATAILVTTVTIAYDLMAAVGIGLLLATFQFVRAQVMAPVIHRRSTVAQRPSLRKRSEKHRQLLAEHAGRILIYELEGNLFFGTVDKLFEHFSEELDHPVQLILDMARVRQVDLTAVKMLQQMADRLHRAGGELIFTNVRSGKGLSKKVDKTLRTISPHHHSGYPVKTFIDVDEAIEYAEDRLLTELGEQPSKPGRVALRDSDLCHDLADEVVAQLQAMMKPLYIQAGDTLFEKDEHGAELFVVLKGEIDIKLAYSSHHYKRLAKFGPGMFFGEIVFLKPGPRTAQATAVTDAELLMLDSEGFRRLQECDPAAAIRLLLRLARELSARLRHADAELRRLSE